MSKYTEEELNQALEDTGRLLQDVPLTQEYDLDDILAEFGTGAVKPKNPPEAARLSTPETEEPLSPAEEPVQKPEPPAAEPAPEPEAEDEHPTEEEPEENPEEQPEAEEPKERLVSIEDVMDRTVSAVMEEEGRWATQRTFSEESAALGFAEPAPEEPMTDGRRRALERRTDQIVSEIVERHGLKRE